MRKYRYHFIIVLLIIFNVCVVIKNKNHYLLDEYAVSINEQEKKLEEKNKKYKIRVYYPDTEYKMLDDEISDKMSEYLSDFKSSVSNKQNSYNQYYTLNILYNKYSYQNYISYVFYVEIDTGGAHPDHDIWTIVYDLNDNTIVEIDDLITENKNFLEIVSEYTRKKLLKNPIVDTEMLMYGTEPIKSNFSRYVFSDEGIIFFFPHYQIAPYSSGSFVVEVPYFKLNNKTI